MFRKKYDEKKLASFLLRAGLAVVFLYAGVSAVLNPSAWIGFIPVWLRNLFPAELFLQIHAIFDITIGVWMLTGKKQFYASAAAGLSLLSIVVFNIGAFDVIFRDVAILFSAAALMVLNSGRVK